MQVLGRSTRVDFVESRDSSSKESRTNGGNSLRPENSVTLYANQLVEAVRTNECDHDSDVVYSAKKMTRAKRRRSDRQSSCRRACVSFMLVLLALHLSAVTAFRQEPVASPARPTKNTLESQKNLIDDVQDGETSRLQRLIPSAWRNKNMSSWEFVESVRSLCRGGMTAENGEVLGRNADTLSPLTELDKTVGKLLSLLGKAVMTHSVVTFLTSNVRCCPLYPLCPTH